MAAPTTGLPPSSRRPLTTCVVGLDALQTCTVNGPWVSIRAPPAASVAESSRCGAGVAIADGVAACAGWNVRNVGGGDCFCDAPSANTCSCEATPPFEDVGVPPTVIATYSLPPAEKIVGPAAIWCPVWNVQRIFPVFTENAR